MVTAPANPSSSPLRRALPILGVLVALGVAVGAWLLPRSMVEPESRAAPLRGDGSAGGSGLEGWITPEPQEWATLAAGFDTLREPDPVRFIPPEPVGGEGGEKPPEPVAQRVLRPAWSYQGYIGEPDRRVAVITTRNGQRLVYEGETIVHADDPSGPVAFTVTSVTPDRVTIAWEENEFTFDLIRVTPRSTPSGPGRGQGVPSTPGPAVPPSTVPRERQ